MLRRGVNLVYIVENNGVYGLTKGQFSATADRGSKSKRGVTNTDNSIDLVALALQLGATFVARSFSGDKEQMVPLIKAAIEHEGAAFIDIISPCVAFNNHVGSTKSFDYVREHNESVNRLDFITGRAPITVAYEPGSVEVVEQHDGSKLALKKIAADYDAHDRLGAMSFMQQHAAKGQIVTRLLYVTTQPQDLHHNFNTVVAQAPRRIPDLGSSSSFAWTPLTINGGIARYGTGWFDPPAGLRGPIKQDPDHPLRGNETRRPTPALGNWKDPILKPWAAEQMRLSNEELLSAQVGIPFLAQSQCWPGREPGQLLWTSEPVYFIQTLKQVWMVWHRDQWLRPISMTDQHSEYF